MSVDHEVAPNHGWQRAAGHPFHWAEIIIADPYTGNIMGGIADEPSVPVVLAGSCFAGGWVWIKRRLARGADGDCRGEHIVHGGNQIWLDNSAPARPPLFEKNLSLDAANLLNNMGENTITAIRKRNVGGGDFQRRHFRGAKGNGGIAMQF